MSLNTVLKIGKAFKTSDNNYQYLSYLYNPKDTDYRNIFRVALPLKEDFSFDWEHLSILTNEQLYDKLYELRFKTSGSDSTIKYLYGDIFYEQITKLDKKGKIKPTEERGRIQLQKGDTFKAAQKNVDEILDEQAIVFIKAFLNNNEPQIIALLETDREKYEKKLKDGLLGLLIKEIKKYTPEQKIKVVKKYKNLQSLIADCLKYVSKQVNKVSLAKFRRAFAYNQDKINTLLRYSNAFEEYLSNPQLYGSLSTIELLENDVKLKELSAKYTFENAKEVDLKKIFGNDYKDRKITMEEKLNLASFTNHSVFIHFVYPNNKMWYNFDGTWDLIFNNVINAIFSNQNEKYVLDKSVYRTLASGDKKNDIQFPAFRSESKYKSQYFDNKQVQELMYGLHAYKSKALQLKGTDIILTVLPKGENLTAEDYDNFIKRRVNAQKIDEENQNNKGEEREPLFMAFFKDKEEKITSFDVILVNTKGNTDKDLVEMSGVKKSTLDTIRERIDKIANQILDKKKLLFNNSFKPKIEYAYQNILGNPQVDKNGKISFKANARYEMHLLKVLPQIYCMNYYQDRSLLPSFIEKVEFATRYGSDKEPFFKYQSLKYDLEFLLTIQNSKNNKYMEMVKSDSYHMGYHLGKMANVVSQQINSFEKNYVGNLSRRISRLNDFMKLKNEIIQKLINHDKMSYVILNSKELDEYIKKLDETNYHKDKVAFGFFEGYYDRTSVSAISKLKELIRQYPKMKDDIIQDAENIIEKYNTIVANIKSNPNE